MDFQQKCVPGVSRDRQNVRNDSPLFFLAPSIRKREFQKATPIGFNLLTSYGACVTQHSFQVTMPAHQVNLSLYRRLQ